jgi:hypothetical protein
VVNPVAVVRKMWEAWADNRLDDVIATMDPDVSWEPIVRPGLTIYRGHDAIRRLRDDVTRVYGPFRTEVDSYVRKPNGTVRCRGLVVGRGENDTPFIRLAFEARCIVFRGKVLSVDTNEIAWAR